MGRKISDPSVLEFPQPKAHNGTITGEIIVIDRFGNLISNISEDLLQEIQSDCMSLKIGGKHIRGLKSHYSQCKSGDVGCLINSWGKLEIFCREDNAANKLKCRVGTSLTIKKN